MDRIILIAQQLVKEGKTPNTSLIKARLPKNTPLPTIIQGLKMWQENPNKKIDTPTEPALTGASIERTTGSIDELIESRITELVAPLKKEIDELKKQIKVLQSEVIKTNTAED
ncbi:hypothetical protein [Psychromonas aquatilis]|uniref:KfrA N-terminal DNA-binding domain-containing protein n=1 Tax=Psychromonas aquatilis TaxID=2005072 RepID=A0ABU9GRX3_9GAMM